MSLRDHWDAIIAAIPPTLAVLWSRFQSRKEIAQVHIAVNSRMEELLRITRIEAHAAGKKQEKDEEDERHAG